MADVISVSQLNRYVKQRLDMDDALFDLALRGEIANFVQNARSGHCYFTLRDEASSVKAVMFRADARRLAFRPEEGMRVVVRCRVTLYERDGAFQVYVNAMFPDGLGEAQLALEQLKARLEQEGLFAPEHKKPLPRYPRCIGIVTSKTGAALQDIRNVIGRRWPSVRLLLCPVTVQGFEAAGQVAQAIRTLDRSGKVDEIIVARGGGSREDLWVFNAIDYTILDFVADRRAPTPSAAAELAVPDREEQLGRLQILQQNISKNMQKRLDLCYNGVKRYNLALERGWQRRTLQNDFERLAVMNRAIPAQMQARLSAKTLALQHQAALAASLDPYQVLARGYALLTGTDGTICTPGQLQPGQTIYVCGTQRQALCRVETVEERNESTQKL